MKLIFTFLILLLISNNSFSNEYFNALELFNKEKFQTQLFYLNK